MNGGRMAAGACVAIAAVLCGCGADDLAPPAPGSDGSTGGGPIIGGGGDGGSDMDGGGVTDGGGDAGLPLGCVRVTPDDAANNVTVETADGTDAGTGLPFSPDRAYLKWSPDPCDAPESERRLLAALTEGQCGTGLGKRLVFSLQGDQVGTGITPGPQPVAFSSFMGVLFVAPQPGETPNERWSNTADSSGNVTIEEVGDAPGDSFRASLDFTLPSNDSTPDPALRFQGNIDVTLEQTFDEVCRGAPDGGA